MTQNHKGSVLIYTIIISALVAIIFAGIMQFVLSQIRSALNAEPRQQSIHIAESGVYFYRWYLAHKVEGKSANQVQAFWDGDPLGVDDNGDGDCDDPDTADGDGDGTEAYVVDHEGVGFYSICVTPPTTYSTELFVEAEGWTNKRPSIKRAVRARLRKPSWSEFAVMGNAATRLGSGTEVFGPMHFNNGIRFDGVAHNVVSSSVDEYTDPDTGNTKDGVWTNWGTNNATATNDDLGDQKVFIAGAKFPPTHDVVEQDFNALTADFSVMKSITQASDSDDQYYFNNAYRGRHIILKGDTMDVYTVRRYGSSSYTIYSYKSGSSYTDIGLDIPDEGVIYVNDNVWIEGELDAGKRLTIAAHSTSGANPNLFIGTDDVTYNSYDGDTVLGLVAENNIRIIRNSPEDLRVDAAMIAQKGQIGILNYGIERDRITTYGALVSNTRMNFGWTNGSGYVARDLIFDNNLLYAAPPLFPTGNSYAIDLWEEI